MDNTIEYYNSNYEQFVSSTISLDASSLHDYFIMHLDKGSKILDLGCGTGRDSYVFKGLGYDVVAIDGSQKMCEIASKLIGQEVLLVDIRMLDFKNLFDGIWACASLLHIPFAEMENVYHSLIGALHQVGFIYVSYKYGVFEGIRNGRYFTDMNEDKLLDFLKKFPELTITKIWVTEDLREDRKHERWLNVILKKS